MNTNEKSSKAPFFLLILDGFGLRDASLPGNAITKKTAPNIFRYFKEYASTTLVAHGEAVGLFPDQEGNSEAGHLNIGAGRVVEQDMVTIQKEIENGAFFENPSLLRGIEHAKKQGSAVHLMGLLTDGQSAHAHPEHLYALLELLKKQNVSQVFLHLFTDGRDAPPQSARTYLEALEPHLSDQQVVVTLLGRFYAMDRAKNWERTELAYDALTQNTPSLFAPSMPAAIGHGYARGESDEYLRPTVISHTKESIGRIQDNDTVIFFNCRSDRARQILKPFVQTNFETQNPGSFERKVVLKNLCVVALTEFGPDLPGVLTAYPSTPVIHPLAFAIGASRRQLYLSETEKFAHVTYFLNGGHPESLGQEKREAVESKSIYSFAEAPEGSLKKLVKRIFKYMALNKYDFFGVNFANADMAGHTGNVEAAKVAIAALDRAVGRIVEAALRRDGTVVIVSDHGNAEEMIDAQTQAVLTQHTKNPVPFIVIKKEQKGKHMKPGTLADVAPTVLDLLDISKPKEMTGETLLSN